MFANRNRSYDFCFYTLYFSNNKFRFYLNMIKVFFINNSKLKKVYHYLYIEKVLQFLFKPRHQPYCWWLYLWILQHNGHRVFLILHTEAYYTLASKFKNKNNCPHKTRIKIWHSNWNILTCDVSTQLKK